MWWAKLPGGVERIGESKARYAARNGHLLYRINPANAERSDLIEAVDCAFGIYPGCDSTAAFLR